MELRPRMYMCREHQLDLTSKVEQELQSMALAATTPAPMAPTMDKERWQAFQVIVDCPGRKDPHKLLFAGDLLVGD